MYEMLGICLALAALLAVNACASALAALAWRVMRGCASRMRADVRARLLFALRILPPALAAALVFALVVPAYSLMEPSHTEEVVGLKTGRRVPEAARTDARLTRTRPAPQSKRRKFAMTIRAALFYSRDASAIWTHLPEGV